MNKKTICLYLQEPIKDVFTKWRYQISFGMPH